MIEQRFYGEDWTGTFRFLQIAWVVEDLYAACHNFVRLYGTGPFHVMRSRGGTMTYRGNVVAPDITLAVAQMGPVQIELITQNCDTPSIYTRELKAVGAVHHVCAFARDYDAAAAHYAANGAPAISEIDLGAYRVGYFDTRAALGMLTEVVEENAAMRTALEKIATTCASWDGTDPIRILTRDGYKVPA